MEKLFGVPIDTFMIVLVGLLALGLLVLAVIALRDRVVFKMAVRNIPRRKAQSTLIIVGLMLATLLFSASFSTGDTMTHSIRLSALEDIGSVDEVVIPTDRDAAGRLPYFSDEQAAVVAREATAVEGVVGAVPVAREQAPVLAAGSGLSEPAVDLLGLPPEYPGLFGALVDEQGAALELTALGTDGAYLSTRAAEKLDVATGDRIQVFLGPEPTALSVNGIYTDGAHPAGEVSMVLPLARVQDALGTAGSVNGVLIENSGDVVGGAVHSDAVVNALEPLLGGTGLEVVPIKQDALDQAEEVGSTFSTIFLVFAQFSIAAGILLIFLIFVMLAAERKHELGMARAVGAQRGHVVRMFALEGAAYALIAAAVGSVLGVLVGWGMVRIMAAAFGTLDLELAFDFSWRSMVIAYALGVVFTFFVVFVSSWRVSRLNIVRAVRDLPEPRVRRRGRRELVGLAMLLAVAVLAILAGLQGSSLGAFFLGVSLLLIGLALLGRRLGVPERVAFTTAGVALLAVWLMPRSVHQRILPDMNAGMEMFFISGIMLVIAAVWVVVYNSDLLVRATVAVIGRFRTLPPILKTAVAYPMQNRFRTGMTLAMFALVVFTLVCMSFIIAGMGSMFQDEERLAGGFGVRASTSYTNPIADLDAAVADVVAASPGDPEIAPLQDVTAVATLTGAVVEGRQAGSQAEPGSLLAQGIDETYAETSNYDFVQMAPGFSSAREVWRALRDQPGTVVVAAGLVPTRVNYSMGDAQPPFVFEGFYVQDDTLPPDLTVEVRDPATGRSRQLRVIGVLSSTAFYTGYLMTSDETLAAFFAPQPVPPVQHYLALSEGADQTAVARSLEKLFLANGMQAESTGEEIRTNARATVMVNTLLQGFMALGLVVGIASLGVIAARAVVERRKQIGVLRAMGFQKAMVQSTFLLESSFVALLGIGLGVALGAALSPSIISQMSDQFDSVQFTVPWLQLTVVIVVAYAASLLTTFLPARQAAKVYPAEALRYE